MTIVSIDTNDPKVKYSTGAVVKVIFSDDSQERYSMIYTGNFNDNKEALISFIGDVDHIVIEKIDSTNSFLSRSVIEEQLNVKKILTDLYSEKVQELVRSGRKEVITDALMKQIGLWEEPKLTTHHHDVREATRNLLYYMAKSKTLNPILSKYVRRFFK